MAFELRRANLSTVRYIECNCCLTLDGEVGCFRCLLRTTRSFAMDASVSSKKGVVSGSGNKFSCIRR